MKERYRIEILDKKENKKIILLTNNYIYDIRYHLIPIHIEKNQPQPQMVNAGYEHVNISIHFPKVVVPLKKKKKAIRRRKKKKIRKH